MNALQKITATPIVPVFHHADAEYARRVVQACYDGGMRAFEFTNRGPTAGDIFADLREYTRTNCPEMVLGIGTIYSAEQATDFLKLGADFLIQPVMTPEVGIVCRHAGIPWIPGAMTPSEIYASWQQGADVVKVFPGTTLGPEYIRAVRGPMPDIKLMVTGGVEPTEENLRAWFGAGVTAVGIGSQLFQEKDGPSAALSQRIQALLNFLKTMAK